MAQKLGQITNADFYINDIDLAGRVKEFKPDNMKHTEVKHETLGMIGVLNLPGRPVQELGGTINFEWIDEEVERELLNPTKLHKIQMHSYVDVFDDNGLNIEKSHTLVTHIGFHIMESGILGGKLGDAAGVDHKITFPSYSLKVYGQATPIIEYDVHNRIYNVNGQPVWPT